MFALGATKAISEYVPDTTMVSIPILMAFAIALFINIRTSVYPASAYGFNTHNWQGELKEAFVFSIPVAVLIVVAKWILTMYHPAMTGLPVFDFSRSSGLSLGMVLVFSAAYGCFAPVQEMIARSGLQNSFQLFLTGRYKIPMSIFLSTLLFSSTHLHVSPQLAALPSSNIDWCECLSCCAGCVRNVYRRIPVLVRDAIVSFKIEGSSE